MGNCIRCQKPVEDLGNVCIDCGAKHDAYLFHRNKALHKSRHWYTGNLDGLSSSERIQYTNAFEIELTKLLLQ